jgi:hypothetical protein
MSLINEALKRAKDKHDAGHEAAACAPALKPAAPDHHRTTDPALLIATVLALFVALGILFGLQLNRRRAAMAAKAAANAPTVVVKAPTLTIVATVPAPASGQSRAMATAPPTTPAGEIVRAQIPLPASPAPGAATEAAPAPPQPPPPPQPTGPRLQAIFYSATDPSALISGTTVRIGDRFQNFRVSSITTDTVTLESATQTNVMMMSVE